MSHKIDSTQLFQKMAKPNAFGLWLLAKLKEKNLNKIALAERAGISRQYVTNLTSGRPHSTTGKLVIPTVEAVDKIAKALGVSITEARQAAGYVPAERPNLSRQIADEEFAGLFHKYEALPDEKDKEAIQALLKMVDRELDARLNRK